MNKRTLGWLIVIVVVVGGLYALSKRSPGPGGALQGTVRIGVVLPLTGDAAAYGTPFRQSVELAVDEVNASGGVGGKRLAIVVEDGKCSGPEATNAIQKLVNVDQVKLVIGGACSGETLAMAPIVNEKRVVLISPSATSPDITTKGGDYVFRTAPSDAFQGRIAAEYAYGKLNLKKVAVVSESTDYAQGLRKVFKQRFGELGGAVAVDEVFNPGEVEFRSIATKVKATNPDLVYIIPQVPATGVNFVKQYRGQNGGGALMTAEVLAGRDILKENASIFEGLYLTELAADESVPETAAFLTKYKAKYGDPSFPSYQAGAYDIVFMARDAIAAHGENGEALQRWFAGVKDRKGGALGQIGFDGNGDPLIAAYAIKRVKGGVGELLSVERTGK